MSKLTPEQMDAILSGDPEEVDVHLTLLEKNVEVQGTKVKVHCHCLAVDANSQVQVSRLAEFMRAALIDYAIPRTKIAAARERDAKYKSSAAITRLHYEAKGAFTDLENSGEGGELLLFLLAERYLKIPHVLCKMDLKTDTRVHYHGADGVYARVGDDGILKLFWGESKLYQNPTDAIRDCLASLAPFLAQKESENAAREKDLILLSDKADLDDEELTEAFKKYFDKSSPKSNRVAYCGVAMVGFDVDFYAQQGKEGLADLIATAARDAMTNWVKNINNRISVEKLEHFEIEFLCIPLPSVSDFRGAFRKAIGLA